MRTIRPFRSADGAALAGVCVATADAGSDATGILDDDDLWPCLYLDPYLERHPDLAFVVTSDDDVPLGYIVATDDTAAFEAWFAASWWPRFADRWPLPGTVTTRQDDLIAYGWSRGRGDDPSVPGHPAHLHIDLLAEAQGDGWGRRLIDSLCDALAARGVEGVHAGVSKANPGALAFYPRVGFVAVEGDDRGVTFGRTLGPVEPLRA